MNLKQLSVAIGCAMSLASAQAADQVIDLSSGTGSFIGIAPLLSGGTDVISFSNLAAGSYDFSFTLSSQRIGALSVSLNGVLAEITPAGSAFTFASLAGSAFAPFVLTISGTPGSNALYSGELTVSPTPVPEVETYALLLAGLGVTALVLRRRQQS